MNDNNSRIYVFEDEHGAVIRVQSLTKDAQTLIRSLHFAGWDYVHDYLPSEWERYA